MSPLYIQYLSPSPSCIHRRRFRTGFYLRSRARGGLVRSTARTPRALPCESGTVLKIATAATRPLSLVWRRLCRDSTHALPRAMTLTHLAMTLGHAVAVSRIPTAISLSYRALTHAVPLTHGASPIHGLSPTHAILLTLAMTLVLCTRFSTHFDTLVPLTTHTGTIALGIRVNSRGPGVSIPPKLRMHPFTALFPSTSHGATEPTWSRSASRGHIPSPRSWRRLRSLHP